MSLLGCSPGMTGESASGAQGEHEIAVPLHDNLGSLHYKLTDDALAAPAPGDLFHDAEVQVFGSARAGP